MENGCGVDGLRGHGSEAFEVSGKVSTYTYPIGQTEMHGGQTWWDASIRGKGRWWSMSEWRGSGVELFL